MLYYCRHVSDGVTIVSGEEPRSAATRKTAGPALALLIGATKMNKIGIPRADERSVEQLLSHARSTLAPRLSPTQAYEEMGDGATLVDIRHLEQRMRDGVIPGAVLINRNEFEWRCDPSASWRNARIAPHQYDQRVIVLCNQGYQSSLAAANLQYIGMKNVTDVIGGFEAWRAAGLPIVPHEDKTLDTALP